ncbi:MAG: hypothetical protein JKY49_00945 [Cohaesibacteraceae bacterium]|nr:hypothetical protein [Cohaesibacteraceae bacterium]MBL4877011.1 hypothetical protein [Cohaesibacteraceae bacterium]
MTDDIAVAVICHDAGGAEILSNWVVRQSSPYILVLEGPSKSIFERKLGAHVTCSLDEAIENADWVLTGTSWQSDIEIQAIKLARQKNKKSVSFLDHWVNYQERFKSAGELILPDEIWVGDEDAFRIAGRTFPGHKIKLKPNPYFENMAFQIEKLKRNSLDTLSEKKILYVCSPVKEHAKLKYGDELYWEFTEEDAVRYFMANVHLLNHSTGKVVLRPHPSEENGKYDWATTEFAPDILIGGEQDLLDEIANADIVAGFNSMAMVIGLIAGKRIINALPPGKIVNTLPMKKIEQLSDIAKNQ